MTWFIFTTDRNVRDNLMKMLTQQMTAYVFHPMVKAKLMQYQLLLSAETTQ